MSTIKNKGNCYASAIVQVNGSLKTSSISSGEMRLWRGNKWRRKQMLGTASSFTREEAEALVASHPWWYHRIEVYPGVFTPGVYDPSGTLGALGLPEDMRGMTVLEIGPADGYFTKQLTLRGARVTACELLPKDRLGFAIMEKLHGQPLDFHQVSLFGLQALNLPKFDVVLCLGVLYHLPDMMRGIYNLRQHCGGQLILETLVSIDLGDEPLARYHPAKTLNNDETNFWSPNIACVEAMLMDTGFKMERHQVFASSGAQGRTCFWASVVPDQGEVIKTDQAYASM